MAERQREDESRATERTRWGCSRQRPVTPLTRERF